jgi:nucleoside-diphosphate-sugar epimerase
LKDLRDHPLVEEVQADLVEHDALESAVKGCSGIIHIAALFRQAGLPDSEFYRVNVEGTRSIVSLAEKYGVRRFVHCSTVGVHGHIESPPGTEDTPFAPGDVYQCSKLAGEMVVRAALSEGRLSGMIIRPAMIYGPGDRRTLKLFKMISKGLFFYVGRGDGKVHFVDVRDLACAFRLALEREDVSNEAVIVAGRRSFELREFAEITASILHVRAPWIKLPVKPMQLLGSLCETICTPLRLNPPLYRRRVDFYTKHREFDFSKARALLDYSPQQEPVDEVIDIINSYINLGEISGSLIQSRISIERTLDGAIKTWGEAATQTYGWEAHQVIGKRSHEILQTIFPAPLQQINTILKQRRRWIGRLAHRTADGKKVDVISHWELLGGCSSETIVRETNRLIACG